jgi:DNA repair exonuclease SbcCD ATPase subunit
MSFAFQREMLSLGTHLNRMITATTKLEENISSVESVSGEVGGIKKNIGFLEDEIRKMEQGSEQAEKKSRRAQELAEKISSIEQELREFEGSKANVKHLEMEVELEKTQLVLRELEGTVHSLVSPLKRPFRKYEKLLESRGAKTDKEILKKIREYQDSPKQAFSGEERSNIILQVILSGLKDSISSGELKLSEREKKKTLTRIGLLDGGMIKDSLKKMEALKEDAQKARDRLSQSDIKESILDLTSRLEALRKEQTESLKESPTESTPKIAIDDIKQEIEETVSQILGGKVTLVIPELKTADIEEDL